MQQKNWTVWLALTVIVVSLGLIGRNVMARQKIANETVKAEKQLRHHQKQLKHKQQVADQRYLETVAKGNDQKSRRAQQLIAAGEAQANSQQFFKILTTYDSQKTWLNRQTKASALASDGVFKNKALFNDGKDNDGHSVIDTLKVTSNYVDSEYTAGIVNGNTIDGNVEVRYRAQTGSNSATTVTDLYAVRYDLQQHKLTQVQRLGVLQATSEDLN